MPPNPAPRPAVKPEFAPIKSRRAFEMICEQIRKELARGTLKVGDRLPPERELAAQFQVSRGAVREAFRSLEVAGIIRSMKGAKGGAFIQAAEPERIVQAMQDYVHLGSITLDELTEARIAILDVIVPLACERAKDADFEALQAIVERTRAAIGVEERFECAVDFYKTLAQATQNRVFGMFLDSLSSVFKAFTLSPGYETLQESLIQSRQRFLNHLKARDCDAAAVEMRKHLERVHRHVRKSARNSSRAPGPSPTAPDALTPSGRAPKRKVRPLVI